MNELPHVHVTEPIVAWRVWKTHGEELISLVYSFPWPVREPMEALCRAYESRDHPEFHGDPFRPEPPPTTHCRCGIYAVKTLALALQQRGNATWTFPGQARLVIGRVSLWGHVIEHELGYRAQYAYPLDLMRPGPGNGLVRPLCRAYAVDEFEQPKDALNL